MPLQESEPGHGVLKFGVEEEVRGGSSSLFKSLKWKRNVPGVNGFFID